MAGDKVAGRYLHQGRIAALLAGLTAAGAALCKAAGIRRLNGRGDLALDDDPLSSVVHVLATFQQP